MTTRPSNFDDLIGRRYGRLIVVEYDPATVKGRTYWICRCDCGVVISRRATHLKRGESQSCGCLQKERASVAGKISNRKHGLHRHPLYRIWCGMLQRCYNPNSRKFQDWGGRGIRVCPEWRRSPDIFIRWALTHEYSRGLTIDRYPNNDGNYEPSNCRFTTHKKNHNNKRSNVVLEMNGKRRTVSEWSDITGVARHTIYERIKLGWDIERALTLPSTTAKIHWQDGRLTPWYSMVQ